MSIKVLHIVPSLSSEWGGSTKAVVGLTRALAKRGLKVSVFAAVEKTEIASIEKIEGVNINLFRKNLLSKLWTSFSPDLGKSLIKVVPDFDLLHIHEIWHHPHFAAYRAAKFTNKPFIITPHGMLEPWCLSHKRLKKKMYLTLIQRRILQEASALHALTEKEVTNFSHLVNNRRVFVIPNGLDLEEFKNLPNRQAIEFLYPQMRERKVILFLGRIHPKKGLDLLARAFRIVSEEKDDVLLVVAGPDKDHNKDEVVKILRSNTSFDKTVFTGMLTGNAKLAVLSRADVFVLPSYSEGLSISILEAMACGLPVVISRQCNFPEVQGVGAGKIVRADANVLADTLIELLDNPRLCKELGTRAKRLVKQRYNWYQVANRMITAYEETLEEAV